MELWVSLIELIAYKDRLVHRYMYSVILNTSTYGLATNVPQQALDCNWKPNTKNKNI